MSAVADLSAQVESFSSSGTGSNQDAEIQISVRAYSKIVLHAAKYPHCAINGLLIAKLERRSNRYYLEAWLDDLKPALPVNLRNV